ncbi:hypothetical protein [Edaphobacter acidisoli]|nr:hypothetical protein [Edaphobacter acidisoli]
MSVHGAVLSGIWLAAIDTDKWLIVFVGMVAVALVVQAIAVIVFAVGAAKTRTRVFEMIEDLRGKMTPLISVTHDMVKDASPKVKTITDNLVHTSHLIRTKATEFDATATEANAKTRAQVARVDGMVSSVLDATSDAAAMFSNAIRIPARELSGLMHGMKAGLDVLLGRRNGAKSEPVEEQEPVSRI